MRGASPRFPDFNAAYVTRYSPIKRSRNQRVEQLATNWLIGPVSRFDDGTKASKKETKRAGGCAKGWRTEGRPERKTTRFRRGLKRVGRVRNRLARSQLRDSLFTRMSDDAVAKLRGVKYRGNVQIEHVRVFANTIRHWRSNAEKKCNNNQA